MKISTNLVRSSISRDCNEKENSKKLCKNLDGRKFRTGSVCSFIGNNVFSVSVRGCDIKMAGKKQNLALMRKKLMKHVDIDEPTSFLDRVYLGCTQRECEPNGTIIEQYTKMFESRISAGTTVKLLGWRKHHAQTVAWSYDMDGHAQKCVEGYCDLANKKVEQLYKVSHPCLDDHQIKQEELESVGELFEVCSQIVLQCLYLARIGRPDILWSVNKLARPVTQSTQGM